MYDGPVQVRSVADGSLVTTVRTSGEATSLAVRSDMLAVIVVDHHERFAIERFALPSGTLLGTTRVSNAISRGDGVIAFAPSGIGLRHRTMTETEFNDLAIQGYNRIPIVLETVADLDTPLSVYLKLANQPYSYLLESVQGGERLGDIHLSACPLPPASRRAATTSALSIAQD